MTHLRENLSAATLQIPSETIATLDRNRRRWRKNHSGSIHGVHLPPAIPICGRKTAEIPRPIGPLSASSVSQSGLLQPRLAERPARPGTGNGQNTRLPMPIFLPRRQRRSQSAGRPGLASTQIIYESHSHRQISKEPPKAAKSHAKYDDYLRP